MRPFIIGLLLSNLLTSGCGHNLPTGSRLIKPSPNMIVTWDSVFFPGGKLVLNDSSGLEDQSGVTGSSKTIFWYRDIVSTKGLYFLVADDRKSIEEFDSKGHLIRRIGNEGFGPGELKVLAGIVGGTDGSIIAVNLMPPKCVIFYGEGYSKFQDVKLPAVPVDVAQIGSQFFAELSLYGESLVDVFSVNGEVMRKILDPCDRALEIFEATSTFGALWNDGTGRVYVVDPTCNRIVKIDSVGRVVCCFTPGRETGSFAPPIVKFPGGLSPYDRGKNQMDYFETFYHPVAGGMMDSSIFAVEYVKVRNPSDVLTPSDLYVTLFDTSGSVVAGELRPPHRGICIFPGTGHIIETVQASVAKDGKLVGATVYQYTYKLNRVGSIK